MAEQRKMSEACMGVQVTPPVNQGAKALIGVEELKDREALWRAVLAELIGTLILVFVGCGTCLAWAPPAPPLHVALAFGLTLATLAQVLGPVSGCHVNPAVTLGLVVSGRTGLVKGVVYLAAQVVGGIAGAALLGAVAPGEVASRGMGAAVLEPRVSVWQALLVEAIATWLLVTTVLAVTDQNRTDLVPSAAPVAIGLSLAAAHLFAIPFTGSSMNPARALGPALIADVWSDHWIYWAGPAVGAVVAALLYKAVLRPPKEDDSSYNL